MTFMGPFQLKLLFNSMIYNDKKGYFPSLSFLPSTPVKLETSSLDEGGANHNHVSNLFSQAHSYPNRTSTSIASCKTETALSSLLLLHKGAEAAKISFGVPKELK